MPRRILPVACALTLALSACGKPEINVTAEVPEGVAFFPQIVDFEGDAGRGLALTTDADGNPHMSYLAFEEVVEGEEDTPVDPSAPVPPLVRHAHLVDEAWTRSEPAQQIQGLTPEDETAIAVDAEGVHHVAWTAGGQIFYTTDTAGETEPQAVAEGAAGGLSIAADAGGVPWIAFLEAGTSAEGPGGLIRAATLQGERWQVQTVAETDTTEPTGTGIGVGAGGPVVAFADGSGMRVAYGDGSRWRAVTADPEGASGASLALDTEGVPHTAYVTADGTVRHAHSADGREWEISDLGESSDASSTSIAVDAEGVHHVAWESEEGVAYSTNADGEFAEEELPAAAAAGTRPRIAAGAEEVYLAWYDAEGTELELATRSEDEPLLAVPTPEEATGGGGLGAACEPTGTELAIAAANLAFDTDCLAAPAAQPFTIDFDNQDTAQHNVSIYDAEGGTALFAGEIIGTASITYEVEPIEQEGNLYFQCDVHPTMNGTFSVVGEGGEEAPAEGEAAGGGGGGKGNKGGGDSQ